MEQRRRAEQNRNARQRARHSGKRRGISVRPRGRSRRLHFQGRHVASANRKNRRIFQEIQAVGGQCVGISEFDGIDGIGDAANDSEWLKQMISCGKFTIDISERNAKTGQVSLKSTSVATDSGLEEVATTTIDKTAYAKAEAEYEHERKKIDQKDKRFDMDLSKLETERTALKTEYDSVKKVVQDNIERTFGIFS